jgi:hypothetical protein
MGPKTKLTVITPTTGRPSLDALIESMDRQTIGNPPFHILLWDNVRDAAARAPESYNSEMRMSMVFPPGFGRSGDAPGSPLRAIGLMMVRTPWATFADDDVRWEDDHLAALSDALDERNWATTLRTVWSPAGKRLGVDRFESVGDDPTRNVPEEMCDNNCMIFKRELGTSAAVLYRETTAYNDDRLMYKFLKDHAGPRGRTNRPTIHHICPDRLVEFFRRNCSPD